ncbi:MAG TPA: hypothetical protein DDY18_03290 [Flavobacterium sp.]|jgi:hypothetical protein|nr:hypothetical protein [Flavobacterium sp.]
MDRVKIDLAELKLAIQEIEKRTNDLSVTVEVGDRKVKISATDKAENYIVAIMHEDKSLGAQFTCTERLAFMKNK